MNLGTLVLIGAALLALGGLAVLVGVSVWVILSPTVHDGHFPAPPWWWDRHGWDD